MVEFDEAYWLKVISRPDWYLDFVSYAKKVHNESGENSEELSKFNKTVRRFFENALQEGRVALGDHGPNQDKERQPIDTIVIHHTSAEPGYRLSYMNATQLLNVYAPSSKGDSIWSSHIQNGKQVFYVYHWLMRMDGKFERLLGDSQIGWHAGNWEINKRSVAICLDNDYEKQDPTDEILQKLADFIKKNYSRIKPEDIIGHCEASPKTICPGANFKSIWKTKLLNYL